MSNEERNRFRDEENNQDDVNQEAGNEEDYEDSEEEGGGGGAKTAFLVIFIILFLVSTGLLVYSQFFNGGLGLGNQGKAKAFDTLLKDHNRLQAKADSFKMELTNAHNQLESMQQKMQKSSSQKNNNISGTYFEVQIGAFKSFDPARYKNNKTNIEFHMDQGMRKITLGKFTEANAARAFRRDLVRLGIEDAFIVKKRDGERLGIVESY